MNESWWETIDLWNANDLHILFQSVVALILGGMIGWERESRGKWAGLRTHMLVCFAITMLIRVSLILVDYVAQTQGTATLRVNPFNAMEAIIAGVAFLGAGTVFRDPDHRTMRGLTTAASLLAVVPIGVAVAVDRYVLAFALTLMILFVLRVLENLSERISHPNDD